MKKKEIQELKTKKINELKALERKLKEKLVQLKLELKAGKLKNTREYYLKRKDLAIIKTIIREKELNEGS